MKDDEQKLRILCPYCNTPFDTDMEWQIEDSQNYDSGYSPGSVCIEVVCTNCNKLVYKREEYV